MELEISRLSVVFETYISSCCFFFAPFLFAVHCTAYLLEGQENLVNLLPIKKPWN